MYSNVHIFIIHINVYTSNNQVHFITNKVTRINTAGKPLIKSYEIRYNI